MDGLNTLAVIAKFKVKNKVSGLILFYRICAFYTPFIQEVANVIQEVSQFPAPPTTKLSGAEPHFPLKALLSRISNGNSGEQIHFKF